MPAGGAQRFLGFQVGFGINDRPLTQADRRVDSFKNNVIRATDRMGALERKAVTAGRAISAAFHDAKKQISNGVAVLERYRYQLGIAAGMGFAAIGRSVFSAADANETVNKFNVVFGEVANQTRKWADEYAQSIGRSEYATLGWLNSFQDVLVPMGLARDEAAGLSKEMVTLAADLGSFNNVATARAAEAMQSALVGNHEAVRMLGIQLSEAQLNLVAQREGYQKNFRDLDNLTKMQLRFNEMIRQSGDAVNDATRTAMEFNNQWLRFKGNIRDVSIAMGFSFIPSFNKGLIVTNKFLEKLEESEKLQAATRFFAIGVAITGIAAAIGGVSAAWPFIAGIFSISSFGIAAAVTGIVLAIEDLWVGLNGGESTLLPIINKFLAWAGINKDLKGVLVDVGNAALWTWEAIKASFAYIEPLVQSTVIGAVRIFEGAFKMLFSPIKMISGLIKGIVTGDFAMYWDAVDQFYSGIADIFEGIKTIVSAKLYFIGNLFLDIFKLSHIPDIAGAIKEKIIAAANYVKDNPLTLVRFLIPPVNLPDIINKIYEAGRQFIKDKTEIELPAIKLPTLPDLVGGIKSIWNSGKNFVNNLVSFDLPGLSMPDIPDPIAKIDEWASKIKSKLSNIDFGSALKTAIETAMDKLPGWMQGMAKKIMDYLPQSPAKIGPLSQLDRVGPGLTQTIGKGVDKSREQVTGPLSNMWTESMIAEPKTIVRDYSPMKGISDSGFGQSQSVTNNNYNQSNKSSNSKSEKKVIIENLNLEGSNNTVQDAQKIIKIIEQYFDGEATAAVGDSVG
jgi:hypothetical protein